MESAKLLLDAAAKGKLRSLEGVQLEELSPEDRDRLALHLASNAQVKPLAELVDQYDFSHAAELLISAGFRIPYPFGKSPGRLSRIADVFLEAGLRLPQREYMKVSDPFCELARHGELFVHTTDEEAYALFDKVTLLGLDVHARHHAGTDALYYGIEGMNIPLLRYCIDNGVDLARIEERYGAAKILLCRLPERYVLDEKREIATWRFLESHGCDINRTTSEGTVLHHLVKLPWLTARAVRQALALGADPTIRNVFGETARDLLLQQDYTHVIARLLESSEYDFTHNLEVFV